MTTYGNPSTRRVGWVGCAVFAFLAVVSRDPAGALIFGAGVALLVVFALRPRVRVDSSEIVVLNVRAHRVPWTDVDDVLLRFYRGNDTLVLTLAGGRQLPVWALAFGRAGGERYCRDATREIQQTWALATGRAVPSALDVFERAQEDLADDDPTGYGEGPP